MADRRPILLDMDLRQWTVLFAAWLGWGFDVFDGILFTYVAPSCVPTLLNIPLGTVEAATAARWWTGILTSVLLIGWAVGGIVFGRIADRIGRTRTLMLTMLVYSIGTSLCAFAPNMEALILFRLIASLGIGGEWAAGAAMVAEVVPDKRRVEAGALLYTSAPLGLLLATEVVWLIQGRLFPEDPGTAWRYVFLCGLAPAAIAAVVRWFVEEPERWKEVASKAAPPTLDELFTPAMRRITLSGLGMAVVALITWWSCNAFIGIIAKGLAAGRIAEAGLTGADATRVSEGFVFSATLWFNLGGLFGTLLTVPIAKNFGRKPMYAGYFLLSGIAILAAFGIPMSPEMRLVAYFPIGLTIFGVFGSFTYYLPELFPTRLRGTGAGFCYNAGRIVAALGPLLVGYVASLGKDSLAAALEVQFFVGLVPIVGLLLIPFVVETKDQVLKD